MKVGKYRIEWKFLGGYTTFCIVKSTEENGIGIANKHPKDVYDKDKARKKSLLRAMKDYGLTKPERAEIWEAYRTMTKKERW